jgi:hypothetical protein
MSITVRHGDNEFWGPHVFLEGSGDAEEIREDYARESAGWPPLHFAIAEAKPETLDPWYRLGFASYSSVAFDEGPHRADWESLGGFCGMVFVERVRLNHYFAETS